MSSDEWTSIKVSRQRFEFRVMFKRAGEQRAYGSRALSLREVQEIIQGHSDNDRVKVDRVEVRDVGPWRLAGAELERVTAMPSVKPWRPAPARALPYVGGEST